MEPFLLQHVAYLVVGKRIKYQGTHKLHNADVHLQVKNMLGIHVFGTGWDRTSQASDQIARWRHIHAVVPLSDIVRALAPGHRELHH